MEDQLCENGEIFTVRGQWVAAKHCLTTSLDDLNSVTSHLDAYTNLVASNQITRNAKLDEHVNLVSRMKELAGLLIEFCEMTPSIGLAEVEKVNDINKLMKELGCPHLLPLPPLNSEIVEQAKRSNSESKEATNNDLNLSLNETSKKCQIIDNETQLPVTENSEIANLSAQPTVKKRTKPDLCQSTESLSKEEMLNSNSIAQKLCEGNLEADIKETSTDPNRNQQRILMEEVKQKTERCNRYLENKKKDVDELKRLLRILHHRTQSNLATPRPNQKQ